MALNTSQLIIGIIVIFIGYSIFQVWSLKDKVYCTFIRKDGTQIHKYAKVKQERIDFDNSYYNLNPSCFTDKLVWIGILPTWVRCLIFKWDSNQPLNPKTWNNDYDNPRDRKALNRTEDLLSLQRNNQQSLLKGGGKKGMLENLMPIIIIAGFLILGYLIYQVQGNVTKIGIQGNVTQQQLLDLMKALGK